MTYQEEVSEISGLKRLKDLLDKEISFKEKLTRLYKVSEKDVEFISGEVDRKRKELSKIVSENKALISQRDALSSEVSDKGKELHGLEKKISTAKEKYLKDNRVFEERKVCHEIDADLFLKKTERGLREIEDAAVVEKKEEVNRLLKREADVDKSTKDKIKERSYIEEKIEISKKQLAQNDEDNLIARKGMVDLWDEIARRKKIVGILKDDEEMLCVDV